MARGAAPGLAEGRRKPARNDPCPCGSGRKFKVCCGSAVAQAGRAVAARAPGSVDGRAAQAAVARAVRARDAGRVAEAMGALREAIALDPQNATLHLELGSLLLTRGRPAEALPPLDRAVSLRPDVAQGHLRRGMALEQLGWHAEAAEAYRNAVARAPRLAEAHARLATMLLLQDMRVQAAESFRRAAALAPRTAAGGLSGALALIAEGAVDEARSALRRVIALDPDNATAHAELGKLLAEAGKADEASTAFLEALRINPRAAGHFYDLARIRRLGEADRPLLERMIETAGREDLHAIHRIMLELALGKAYDDLDRPEQAMAHLMAANRLKGRIRPLDRDLIRRRVDWQIHTFTPDRIARGAGYSGSPDRTPILVLGMPRSGTTLVESVLACHSQVGAGEELSFWSRRGREVVAAGALPSGKELDAIAQAYLGVLRGISDAPRVTDKKPDNFFWAGLIHLVLPEARIVHCRRHPLDTCVSILGNFFAPRPDFSTEPGDLVFYWREYRRLMAHWRAVLPNDRYVELDYEALVAEPEPNIRRLLEFCGLEWEESCLHPERSERTVSTASLWQVRRPISTGSVGRWRRYEPWLEELRALAAEYV